MNYNEINKLSLIDLIKILRLFNDDVTIEVFIQSRQIQPQPQPHITKKLQFRIRNKNKLLIC